MSKKTYYFVTGNTAGGFVNYLSSNLNNIDQIIIVKHPSATLKANIINRLIQTFQTTYDLEILCSTLGNDYVDGVIIRDKQTAVVTDRLAAADMPGAIVIDLEWFLQEEKKPLSENFIAINQSVQKAYDQFEMGLNIHDDLEQIYIHQMDFSRADELADDLIEKLLIGVPRKERTPHVFRRLFGTNTLDGAVNFVSHLITPLTYRYYLKGRAGTGKSVFMKKVAEACMNHGLDIELYHCSFDPNSVDMVLVRDLDFCIFDSTAPHEKNPDRRDDVVIDLYEEAVAPGTDETYADEIQRTTSAYKAHMTKGMKYLKDAGHLLRGIERNYKYIDRDVERMKDFILQHV